MLTEKCNPPSALAVLITIISNKETIFVLRKKGSRPKKGMKEEEMEKGDCGLPTPMKYKTLKNILEARDFPKTLITNLQTPTTARTQRFYALPKTPKADWKIRPLVSACGGIFDRLGWFLQQLLKPLLKHVKAHLNNTSDLIARFDSIESSHLEGMVPVSFDVVSLYTNIDMEEAINTSLEYARGYKLCLHGLKMEDLWELLHLILDNNVFRYQKTYFKQIRGLAMGNRLSGTLALHGQVWAQPHLQRTWTKDLR